MRLSALFICSLFLILTQSPALAQAGAKAGAQIGAQNQDGRRYDAETVHRYASIVVDADTLEIVHARQIDGQRFPASLTKVMTLYLVFDALNAGTLRLDDELMISRRAARAPPSKLGLRAGKTISVADAIQALSVKSANDVAVVVAENLAGSEAAFAAQMTEKARSLGMLNTVFKNPHGLTDPAQTTTARDMAKLASAVLKYHRRYYAYFGQAEFSYKGRRYKNTNKLLKSVAGVDGFKTGYTHASGYNLIISAQSQNRRLIAVVLGGASSLSRNTHMSDLLKRGFAALEQSRALQHIQPRPAQARAQAQAQTQAQTLPLQSYNTPRTIPTPAAPPAPRTVPRANTPPLTTAVRLRGRDQETIMVADTASSIALPPGNFDRAWGIQIGTFAHKTLAVHQVQAIASQNQLGLSSRNALILPLTRGQQTLYRARFAALTLAQAQTACQALKTLASGCFIVSPG